MNALPLEPTEHPDRPADTIPHYDALAVSRGLDSGAFKPYVKQKPTPAVRMPGPFSCTTIHGEVANCEDGWLAVDASGFPYPIAAEEFERSYELDE